MGYESRLIIGERGIFVEDGRSTLRVIADLRLSKCGTFDWQGCAHESGEEFCIYQGDDDVVAEDNYGKRLYRLDLERLRAEFERRNRDEKYRRFDLAIAVLDSFLTGDWSRVDLVAVQYGY